MSEYAERFIEHLSTLEEKDAGAMAVLRRSMAFQPGRYPAAYPYVERFVGTEWHERDSRRLAAYVVAGLFAIHPKHDTRHTFASACGNLMRLRSHEGSGEGVERRFVSLLNAGPENVFEYVRQLLSLMRSDSAGFDYVRLLDDLARWMNSTPGRGDDRDRLRERWAREFYRASNPPENEAAANTSLV